MTAMERHIFLTGQTELHGSLVTLNSMQVKFREENSTGLIEIGVGAGRQIVLVYANGTQAGCYLLENDQSQPFNLAELSALYGGAPFSVSSVPLTDPAGRAVWLTLESRKQEHTVLRKGADWNRQLLAWAQSEFTGTVEISSPKGQGLFVMQKGKIAPGESVYFNGQDFENELPSNIGDSGDWHASAYAAVPSSNAWKCLLLRQSASRWAQESLKRYESIAGHRFLQVTSREIETLIAPWNWKISIREEIVQDGHFFSNPESTAHAYRAIFMAMGTQMKFVIGGALTLHILTEMFENLEPDQRAALQAYRLIPAAFSN